MTQDICEGILVEGIQAVQGEIERQHIDTRLPQKREVRPGGIGLDQPFEGLRADPPSLGHPSYLHTVGSAGIDWRPAAGYARRGGLYEVRYHHYAGGPDDFGRVDGEVVQHLPLLRENYVLSLHGVTESIVTDDAIVPFYLLSSLGGGDTLRGYSSWRFRDRNAMLLQAEWRIMVNRYLDLAFFYDTGKVAARTQDLDFDNLKDDYGVGVRFHGPFSTPLRVEFARSREGMNLIFSSSAAF